MSGMPKSWLSTNLGSAVDYGRTTKAEPEEIGEDTWVLELEDIEKDTSRLTARITFSTRQSKSTKNRFNVGDVLYGKLRPYLNKVIVADSPGVCTTEIVPLNGEPYLNNRYLFYWLKHPTFLAYVEAESHGVNMPRLGTDTGKAAPFVLAPLPEQKRIADKLDSTLARVEACRDRLDRIPALLKRFRQSILAAATSGRLTEDWRQGRKYSPKPEQFDNLIAEAITGLVRSTADQFAQESGKTPYLKMNNVSESWGYDDSNLVYVECSPEEKIRFQLKPGDWLFNTRNSVELVGKSCVWNGAPIVFNNNLLRVRFKETINPWFVEIWFRSSRGKASLATVKSATTSVAAIYQRSLRAITLDVPDSAEQHEIVRRVEILFAYADRLEARLNRARQQAAQLTPAVLAKAFRGELVPQDPADEPAAALLQRLAASRAAAPKPRRGRKAAEL